MSEVDLHSLFVFAELGLAVITVLLLSFVVAPYGRHLRAGWGPTLPSRLGWVLMEAPSSVGFILIYASGAHRAELVPLVLLGAWQAHYLHRTFIYPLRLRETGKRMPALVMAMGFSFNCLNAWVNARWISHLGSYAPEWLAGAPFLIGMALFGGGMLLNQHSDAILLRLRAPGERGYSIPRGGGYRWVSCPNYLGEILEWTGWAIACWSLAGTAFAIYTVANLAPRALANHRWYRETFADYPAERRALVPFVL